MQQKNTMATAGMVTGILGFVLGWIPLAGIWIGFILGALGIIFGGIGLSKSKNLLGLGRSAAIAGLVLGIIAVVLQCIPGVNLL